MSNQLTFGLMSGLIPVTPFAVGDILNTKSSKRVVVTQISDNLDGQVFVCVNLETGSECIVLEREIAWRSR